MLLAVHEEVRDVDEALRLSKRLVELDPGARELDVLAGALAASGRFEDAVTVASRALESARSDGSTVLAREIERRLRRYREQASMRTRGLE